MVTWSTVILSLCVCCSTADQCLKCHCRCKSMITVTAVLYTICYMTPKKSSGCYPMCRAVEGSVSPFVHIKQEILDSDTPKQQSQLRCSFLFQRDMEVQISAALHYIQVCLCSCSQCLVGTYQCGAIFCGCLQGMRKYLPANI